MLIANIGAGFWVWRSLKKPPVIELSLKVPAPVDVESSTPTWTLYAHPIDPAPQGPQIGVIVTEMGLSPDHLSDLMLKAPLEFALSFSPYGDQNQALMVGGQTKSHELLLSLPVESLLYPQDDPGPLTLLSKLTWEENQARLKEILSQGQNYIGVLNLGGGRFVASKDLQESLLKSLQTQGLIYIEGNTGQLSVTPTIAGEIKTPVMTNVAYLQPDLSEAEFAGMLQGFEKKALEQGPFIIITPYLPKRIDLLISWVQQLPQKNIILVPVSNIANLPRGS